MNGSLRDPERLQRAQDLFHAVCELHADEQEQALSEACGSDAELRMTVETLLSADRVEDDALSDAAIDAEEDDAALSEFERFEIVREIGRGGMGIVYEARQHEPRRSVAIKMLRQRAGGAGQRARIRREAQMLARLQHPCIAVVLESGEHRGSPYIVMELVRGVGIAEAVAGLTLESKLEVIARIAEAMHHAHQKGIIHRDLKPDNILAVQDPEGGLPTPKVLDFGIAHAIDPDANLTDTLAAGGSGELLGTLAYMSPEQLDGHEDIDVRADVYALGIIAYELLTGEAVLDFSSTPVVSAIRQAAEHVPARAGTLRPELRGDVEIIVATAIEKDRDRRYQSALDFATDIRRYLRREPIQARPPTLWYQASRFAARNRGLVAGVAAAIVAVVVGVTLTVLFASSEHRQRRATERLLYGSIVSNAASSLREGDVHTARSLLDDADPRLRGWEWNYLDRAVGGDHIRVETGLSNGSVVPAAGGNGFRVVGGRDGEYLSVEVGVGGRLASPISFGSGFDVYGERLFVAPDGQIQIVNVVEGLIRTVGSPDTLVGQRVPFECASGASVSLIVDDDMAAVGLSVLWQPTEVVEHPSLGRVVAAYSAKGGGCVAIVSAETGRVLHTLSPIIQSERMAWDEAGSRLFGADLSGRMVACDSMTGATTWGPVKVGGSRCAVLRYVPETDSLLCGFLDGTLAIIDGSTGRVNKRTAISDHPLASVAVSADGATIAALDLVGAVSLVEREAEQADVLVGHDSWVNPITISRDGSTLVSGAWDGTVRVWDAHTGELQSVIPVERGADSARPVLDLAISPDGTECVAVSLPRTGGPAVVHRLSLSRAEVESSIRADDLSRVYPTYDASGGLLLFGPVSRAGEIGGVHRDLTIGSWFAGYPVRQAADRCVFVRVDGTLIVAGLDGDEPEQPQMQLDDETRFVAIGPDARTVAFGGASGVVELRDVEGRRPSATLRGHTGEVLSIAWSPNGERIATASRDGTVGIWDAATLELLVRLPGHEDYVFDVLWSPDGSVLYSSSGDGTIRLWRGQG